MRWPDRYFVPGQVRGYGTIGAPSRVGGDGAMVSGAGGLTERRVGSPGVVVDAPFLDDRLVSIIGGY
jgi:hypothetical protein